MKTKIIYSILKVFGYLCGLCGGILFIGSIGSYEIEQITLKQFCAQELIAVSLLLLAVFVYQIRFDLIWYDEYQNNKK